MVDRIPGVSETIYNISKAVDASGKLVYPLLATQPFEPLLDNVGPSKRFKLGDVQQTRIARWPYRVPSLTESLESTIISCEK
jgi:hypothetical protein